MSWAPLCVNIVGEKFLFTNHFGKCNFTPIIGGVVCVGLGRENRRHCLPCDW